MNKYLLSGDKDITQFRKAGKALRQDRYEWGILIAQGLVFFGLIANKCDPWPLSYLFSKCN